MNPPDLKDIKTSTLDMARYAGYLAAKSGRSVERNEYVEPHHKQAWRAGHYKYTNEHK